MNQPPSPQQRAIAISANRPVITRPMTLEGNTTYAATWLRLEKKRELFIASHGPDGRKLYGPVGYRNVIPLSELPADYTLSLVPPEEMIWSVEGLMFWTWGAGPDEGELFVSIKAVVGRFIDFDASFASQDEMETLVATFVMSSYCSDAFSVVCYLWITGLLGSGKTDLLMLICKLGYLGQMILSQSSPPTLRDLADCGALLGSTMQRP